MSSIIAETLRNWAHIAETANTRTQESAGYDHTRQIENRQIENLRGQLEQMKSAVGMAIADLQRKVEVLDARQEQTSMPEAAAQVEEKPKRQRRRKAASKAKTTGIKRKRRTKAQMLADASQG